MMEYHDSMTKAVKIGAVAYGISRIAVLALNASMKSLRVTMATMPWGSYSNCHICCSIQNNGCLRGDKSLGKTAKGAFSDNGEIDKLISGRRDSAKDGVP